MNKINLNLDKSKKYVVACSFGPDSMALLALAIEKGLKIVVAHVNYRKRKAAVFEQKSLEKFCDENNIKIYVLDLLKKHPSGNFQNWAREIRYDFFKKVLKKEGADAVLVAHQEDDLIETYLMQEKRGIVSKNAGIPSENDLFGIQIIRPLLNFSKKELMNFDDENGIPYSIDESNLTDAYLRNKIRHEIVEKMSKKEREKILEKIRSKTTPEIELKTAWNCAEFLSLSYEQIVKLLDHFMNRTNTHRDLSEKFVVEIKKAFKTKSNCLFKLTESVSLEKDYEEVFIVNLKRVSDYEFTFDDRLGNDIFDIDFSMGAEDRNIPKSLTGITVKNLDKNTRVIIKDYSSTINRLFIDWKVPHYLRKVWPGFYDKNGKLLYVPRYRKNFKDDHKSKFVFRTNYFTEF